MLFYLIRYANSGFFITFAFPPFNYKLQVEYQYLNRSNGWGFFILAVCKTILYLQCGI